MIDHRHFKSTLKQGSKQDLHLQRDALSSDTYVQVIQRQLVMSATEPETTLAHRGCWREVHHHQLCLERRERQDVLGGN